MPTLCRYCHKEGQTKFECHESKACIICYSCHRNGHRAFECPRRNNTVSTNKRIRNFAKPDNHYLWKLLIRVISLVIPMILIIKMKKPNWCQSRQISKKKSLLILRNFCNCNSISKYRPLSWPMTHRSINIIKKSMKELRRYSSNTWVECLMMFHWKTHVDRTRNRAHINQLRTQKCECMLLVLIFIINYALPY